MKLTIIDNNDIQKLIKLGLITDEYFLIPSYTPADFRLNFMLTQNGSDFFSENFKLNYTRIAYSKTFLNHNQGIVAGDFSEKVLEDPKGAPLTFYSKTGVVSVPRHYFKEFIYKFLNIKENNFKEIEL